MSITVDTAANWRLYTNTLPDGATALGTITRDGCDTGALVQLRNGRYVQVNAGAIRNLDGRAVAAAMGKLGQPPKPPGEGAESHLHIRVRTADKSGWVKQAQQEGVTLAQWVIARLNGHQ